MDERGLDQMLDALAVANKSRADFRNGACRSYHQNSSTPLSAIYSLGCSNYFSEELQRRCDKRHSKHEDTPVVQIPHQGSSATTILPTAPSFLFTQPQ